MADIKPIKPIKLCVNITIPTIDDDSISLYECVGILGNKLQEAIQKINESLGSLEGAYTADNPPPYPVTSVNGKTGAVVIDIPANVYTEDNPPPYPVTSVNGKTGEVVIDIPANVYTEDNPPPYPVTSVNRAETKDVITVFEPEGGSIEDVSQAELIAACKAGARLGAFNQDDGTCRLYHFNLYIDPERVDYNEVAGGGASGVISVNGQTGAVNIFNAPISAATAESVTALNASTDTKINQLKSEIEKKYSTEVLWENAAPNSDFDEQTVTFDWKDYNYYMIYFAAYGDLNLRSFSAMAKKGERLRFYFLTDTTNGAGGQYRDFSSDTNHFGNAVRLIDGTSYDQKACIPIRIYGVKGV